MSEQSNDSDSDVVAVSAPDEPALPKLAPQPPKSKAMPVSTVAEALSKGIKQERRLVKHGGTALCWKHFRIWNDGSNGAVCQVRRDTVVERGLCTNAVVIAYKLPSPLGAG
jgi:hypothetical protein